MRKQQQIWQEEHKTAKTLPLEMQKNSSDSPSRFVAQFREFLKTKGVNTGTAIDIGAGKGRNALFFAAEGFEVYATDYIQQAIDHIQFVAQEKKLQIHTECMPMDEPWKFSDNFFDIAIDSFASIDIETKTGRVTYRDEMYRTLKPGGYVMVTVVSSDDEIESELPIGPEKNSTIWPQNGKFQKNYDKAELLEFYNDFQIVSLKKTRKPAHKLGRDFTATNFMVILRK